MTVTLNAIITCPQCGFDKHEQMLPDTWVVFYQCTSCGAVLRPIPGLCCVFCSFADKHCPSKQREEQLDDEARAVNGERDESWQMKNS